MNLPKKVIGITGCAGSGKSTVSSIFQKWGATILDADRIVHEQLKRPSIRRSLVRQFGREILQKGEINRSRLAKIVFSDDAALGGLLKTVHPPVLSFLRKRVRELRKEGTPVVIDAPLLMETGLDALCDVVLLVRAPRDLRINRIRPRGWTPADLGRRDRQMWPPARRNKRADYIIDNRTTRTALRRTLERTIRDIGNQA